MGATTASAALSDGVALRACFMANSRWASVSGGGGGSRLPDSNGVTVNVAVGARTETEIEAEVLGCRNGGRNGPAFDGLPMLNSEARALICSSSESTGDGAVR